MSQLFNECIRILQITPIRRQQYEIEILIQFANNITFFRELGEQSPDSLKRCMQVLSFRTIQTGETLFKVGDSGSLFYIILKGSVGINIRLPNPEDSTQFDLKEVNILKAGSSFGELALINDAKRTATIVAKEDCIFAVMEKHNYKAILGAQELQKIQTKMSFLCSFPFFSSWSFREIKTISYHFEPVSVTLNQIILKQNDICNHFYVVQDGEFEVQYSFKNKVKSICTLGPGEFFGEESFLNLQDQFVIKQTQQLWMKTKSAIVCKSEIGVAYKITREDIQKRFWDSKTQIVFLQLLSSIHAFRMQKVDQFLTKEQKKEKQDNEINLFVKPLKKGVVQKFNQLTPKSSNDLRIKDPEYLFYKTQEQKAIEAFKRLYKDRNCSYAQVRTFFDQKTIAQQSYFDKDSYYKLFFRFKNSKQIRPLQQMNSPSMPSIVEMQPQKSKYLHRFKNRLSGGGSQDTTSIPTFIQLPSSTSRLKTHIF